jgi:hypothetical protein
MTKLAAGWCPLPLKRGWGPSFGKLRMRLRQAQDEDGALRDVGGAQKNKEGVEG